MQQCSRTAAMFMYFVHHWYMDPYIVTSREKFNLIIRKLKCLFTIINMTLIIECNMFSDNPFNKSM